MLRRRKDLVEMQISMTRPISTYEACIAAYQPSLHTHTKKIFFKNVNFLAATRRPRAPGRARMPVH